MTVNDIVTKALAHFNENAVEYPKLQKYLASININVSEDLGSQIFDYYQRKVLERKRKKIDQNPKQSNMYAEARKNLNAYIETITHSLSVEELAVLKRKIDELVDASILWNNRD